MQTNLICTHTLILNSLLFFSWKKHKRGLLITQVFWSFALVRSSSWEVVEKNVFDFPATSCLISFFPHAVWFSHPRCSPRKEKGEMNYCLAQTNRKIEWARVCMCLKHWNAAFCSPSRGSDETVSCTFPLTDADMLRLHASLCLNSTFLLVQFSFFFLCRGNGLIILWLGWGTKPNWFGKKHHVWLKKNIYFGRQQTQLEIVLMSPCNCRNTWMLFSSFGGSLTHLLRHCDEHNMICAVLMW